MKRRVNLGLILLTGLKRSGKDATFAAIKGILEDVGVVVERVALADPMKDLISKTLDIDLNMVEEHKNCIDSSICGTDKITGFSTNMRKVLQHFGQHMKGYFGKEVWCELAENKMMNPNVVYVVTDIRFPFEQGYFGGATIKIKRGDQRNTDTHESERYIESIEADYVINNNGTLLDLKEKVRDILDDMDTKGII